MLILDEPTSGVDPLARDRFWELLIDLSRNQGVTIFVSTHFMNEAERCDRISLMDSGRVLATDTPAGLVSSARRRHSRGRVHRYLEEASRAQCCRRSDPAADQRRRRHRQIWRQRSGARRSAAQRLFACTIRETLELLRDPIRLGFALFGTTFLMLVFGFGISTDVNNLSFAVLDRDQSHESRAYLEEMRGSPYFLEKPAARRLRRSREAARKRATSAPASKSRPALAAISRAGGPCGSPPGSMARGRSSRRRSAAISQGMHQLYLVRPGGEDDTRNAAAACRISRSGSSTIRISTASMPWCRRQWRWSWRCSRRS